MRNKPGVRKYLTQKLTKIMITPKNSMRVAIPIAGESGFDSGMTYSLV